MLGIRTSKRNVFLGLVLLIGLPLFAWVGVASAQTFRTGDTVTVGHNQSVDGTLWASGKNIDIAGTVNGDVFCVGQNVTLSGTVKGDVICAGQTVRVTGTVSGDVRLGGQTVVIDGTVGGSATVGAQTFTLDDAATIAQDLTVGASTASLNGSVGRDAALGTGTATLTSKVGRDVQANVEHLALTGSAAVGGNLIYTSANHAKVDKGAEVAGTTTQHQPSQSSQHHISTGFVLAFALYLIVALLIVALVLVLLLPQMFHSVTSIAVESPFKALLVGLVAALIFPFLFIALLLTVIGIPLAFFALAAWLVILAFSGLFFSYYLGRLLLRNQTNPIWIMLVGAIIVLVLYLIPFLNILVGVVVIWMGSGMALLALQRQFRRPHYVVPHNHEARA